jgi:HSP20 family protein
MDLHEDAEKNLVTATFELPGLSKDQVNIDVHNGSLTVSGSVSESSEREEHPYVIRERRSGRFSRTIKLPEGTDVCFFISFHFGIDTDKRV